MIWIVLPAFNEEISLPKLLPKLDERLRRDGISYRLVAVNDGSVDRTADILADFSQRLPIDVVTHPINRGLGETERDGFEYAAARCSADDIIVRVEGDDTHGPEYVSAIIAKLNEGFDVVNTSRFQPGGGQKGVDGYRAFISRCANYFMQTMFRIRNVRDYSCGYRGYRGRVIQDAIKVFGNNFIQLRGLGFTSTLEIIVKLNILGCRFAEVPFMLRYDQKEGPSKMVSSITTIGYLLMAFLYHWPFGGWRGQYKGLAELYRADPEAAVRQFELPALRRRSASRISFSSFGLLHMCGICGILHLDRDRPVDPAHVRAMADRLKHRGPDDRDEYVDGQIGLGHLRLSIIDLSAAGRQPMATPDQRYRIVYNGEIYNYVELREQLVAAGHTFRSQSDTEVILQLFAARGEACVEELNGMFAFAIWDAQERRLFAARDRFGVKPFYYAVKDGAFVFGSEIKALLATPYVRAEMDPAALADYLTFQFCLGDKTMFKGVRKLEPGHVLTVDRNGVKTRSYWEIDFTIDPMPEAEYATRLGQLLPDAVRLQLRADVPVGAHLSGGLDSTAVACLASAQSPNPIHTFSGGFREPGFDETPYARIASTAAKTIQHEVFATADEFVDLMPRLIYHMDEPAAGPGLFPQYCVSRLASQHVKVVMGGQGGDEIFGGYTRYLIAYLEASLKGGIHGSHEDEKYVVTFESILPNLPQLRGYEPLIARFFRQGLFGDADRRYYTLIDRSEGVRPMIAADVWQNDGRYDPFEQFQAIFNHPNCHALINKMSRFDIKTLLPALLHVEDRTSMAVSLESRVPLLDHRIVELVGRMPPKVKFQGGRTKHIFREVLNGVVPEPIARRTDKMGFPVPLAQWARGGRVRDFVHDTLFGTRARQRGLYDQRELEAATGRTEDYGRALWGLLCLELWHREFLDGATS